MESTLKPINGLDAVKQEFTVRWSTVAALAGGIAMGTMIGAFGIVLLAKRLPIVLDLPTVHVPNNMRIGMTVNGVAALCGDDGKAYSLESFDRADNIWNGLQQVKPIMQIFEPEVDKDGMQFIRLNEPVACRL